jgi:CHAT domain-containing protein
LIAVPNTVRRLFGLAGLAFAALLLSLPQSAVAEGFPKISLSAEQSAKLKTMQAEADKIDQFRDPRAYRDAYAAMVEYLKTIYPDPHPELEKYKDEVYFGRFLLGDSAGLIEAVEQSVAIYRKAGPAYRDMLIATTNNLSVISDQLGQTEKSLELMESAVALWREDAPPGGSLVLGQGIGNLAWANHTHGKPEKALILARESIAMLEQLHAAKPQSRELADALTVVLSNLSIHLNELGRKGEAVEAVRALVSRLDGLVGADSPSAANVLNNGSIYIAQEGKFAEAEAMIRRAIAIREKAFGAEAGSTAEARLAMVSILMSAGRYDDAQPLAELVLRILSEKSGPTAPKTLEARAKLARIAFALGNNDKGIAEMRLMLADIAKKRAPGHKDMLENQDYLANMLVLARRWQEADALLAEVEKVRAGSGGEPGIAAAASASLRALVDVRLGKREAALERLANVAPRLERFLEQEIRQESARGGRNVLLGKAIGWAALAAMDAGDMERGFALAQRYGLGPSDRAIMRARRRDQSADPAAAARLRQLQDMVEARGKAQAALSNAASNGDTEKARQSKQVADDLSRRIAMLEAGDSARMFDLPKLAELQSRLRADEAVLLSLETDLSARLMAISRDGVSVSDAGLSTARIRQLVRSLRERLNGGPIGSDPFEFGETDALANALFTPEVERIIAGKQLVNVVARGELARLPFALLTTTREGGRREWAVERFAFAYPVGLAGIGDSAHKAQSARIASFVGIGAPVLPKLASSGGAGARLRAFRGPVNGAKIAELGPLGTARREMRDMARAMRAGTSLILAGAQATEAGVRGLDLGQADIIAFATHGLMAGELDGLDEAALVLSPPGAEAAADDGLLTTSEIAMLDLRARLVVLSACNSGSGDKAGDDALSGLAHAFLYAGARNLMVSHWRVRDDAAARLTVGTARGMAAGIDAAQALQRAQLALMRDRSVPGASHPALWAPFVLAGH